VLELKDQVHSLAGYYQKQSSNIDKLTEVVTTIVQSNIKDAIKAEQVHEDMKQLRHC